MDQVEIQKIKYPFLLPDNMKLLGFDIIKDEGNGYYNYINDGTRHYNIDYNEKFPEPKGKVILYVNLNYSSLPFICIGQDGDTRPVYNGVCPNEEFLLNLLYNI